LGRTAPGRTQAPEDLAGPVLFLSSAASDAITGQALNVDNGMVHW
jgi:NAD(P)-dependent dehydrogenase (short-subunit alcohol dehydrogenase family)